MIVSNRLIALFCYLGMSLNDKRFSEGTDFLLYDLRKRIITLSDLRLNYTHKNL